MLKDMAMSMPMVMRQMSASAGWVSVAQGEAWLGLVSDEIFGPCHDTQDAETTPTQQEP